MPRKTRIDAAGALHHVIARGVARRKIFFEDKDRDDFLNRLGTILKESDCSCYAWALIPNHFHLLLKTGAVGLSTVMRRLLTGYAVTFNKRHYRWGHLFQNRYKSILCQEEAYLLELTRYIHLNPLRAKLVGSIGELDTFRYCGHGVVMGRLENDWQDRDYILKRFGTKKTDARKKYRRFVEKGIEQGKREDLIGGGLVRSAGGWSELKALRMARDYIKGDERILGDGVFVKQQLEQASERMERKYRIRALGFDMEKIIERVSEVLGIPQDQVTAPGKCRNIVQARSLFCYWAVRECGMTMASLSKKLEISSASIGQSVKRGEQIASENSYLIP